MLEIDKGYTKRKRKDLQDGKRNSKYRKKEKNHQKRLRIQNPVKVNILET